MLVLWRAQQPAEPADQQSVVAAGIAPAPFWFLSHQGVWRPPGGLQPRLRHVVQRLRRLPRAVVLLQQPAPCGAGGAAAREKHFHHRSARANSNPTVPLLLGWQTQHKKGRAPVAPDVVSVDERVAAAQSGEVQQHRDGREDRNRPRRLRRRGELRAQPGGGAHRVGRGHAGERAPGDAGGELRAVNVESFAQQPLMSRTRPKSPK